MGRGADTVGLSSDVRVRNTHYKTEVGRMTEQNRSFKSKITKLPYLYFKLKHFNVIT